MIRPMAELHTTSVDLEGLMRVLGEALYSTPLVAVRELVQNAHDSIQRRSLEGAWDVAAARIGVEADVAAGCLRIQDNGSGLTGDEVHRYLATVGRGYTRELRDEGVGADLIGYFGMGFLSAFAVADAVTVETQSGSEGASAVRFHSRQGATYSVQEIAARDVGSVVTLELREEFRYLLEGDALLSLLERYCCLLRHPIYSGGVCVNAQRPPFRAAGLTPRAYRAQAVSFAQRFEPGEPLTAFALDTDASDAPKGLFWLRGSASFATSDLRRVAVYVRGMFIGDTERELLPPWAGFVGVVLEDDRLTPTASRETLKRDQHYERAKACVRESLIRGLGHLAREEGPTWRRLLRRHNEALLGAALSDDRMFALLAEELTVPTSEGDLTLPEVRRRSPSGIHVNDLGEGGFEELLFRARRVPVVRGSRFGAAAFCHRYASERGLRVVQVGTAEGNSALFREAAVPAATRQRLQDVFATEQRRVVVAEFDPLHLPFVAVRDREAQVRSMIESDEADRRMGQAMLAVARLAAQQLRSDTPAILYVNLRSPVIQSILNAPEERWSLVDGLVVPLVDLLGEAAGPEALEASFRALSETLSALIGAPS